MADNIFSVILEKVGNQPLKTTKVLCEVLGLGLAAAKAMVDKAPTVVADGLHFDKAISLWKELDALGNTVLIPGVEMKAEEPADTKKTIEAKKSAAKKSDPAPLTVTTPSNDNFDAIFGGSTAPKAIAPTKNKGGAKSTQKATKGMISAAPNDEFDAIFGKGK